MSARWLKGTPPAVAVVALTLGALGCGSGTASKAAGSRLAGHSSRRPHRGPTRLTLRVASVGELPAAVADPAAVPLDGKRLLLLGGLNDADTSTASITSWPGGGARDAALPVPQHDAQAAQVGHYVYVFGGGEASSFDHILRYDPTSGAVAQAGQLPTPASDVAVAPVGQTAYVVGGYDGAHWLDSILAWDPGSGARLAGRLPVGLRYAAVAAADDRLIIAGGTTPSGVSDAILSFDPASGKVRQIGRLPVALTHASAGWADGRVLLVGGRRQVSGDQTSAILSIDPRSGNVRRLGRLPYPLSDAAAAQIGGRLIVAGGENATGTQRSVLALTPQLAPGPAR